MLINSRFVNKLTNKWFKQKHVIVIKNQKNQKVRKLTFGTVLKLKISAYPNNC